MTNAEIVNAWFQEKIATGVIARDTEAYRQAFLAKADLIERLDAAATAAASATGESTPDPQIKPETPEE